MKAPRPTIKLPLPDNLPPFCGLTRIGKYWYIRWLGRTLPMAWTKREPALMRLTELCNEHEHSPPKDTRGTNRHQRPAF